LGGDGAREAAGLPAGCGPYRVITQLGVYGFDQETKRLALRSLHPGATVDEVQANSDLDISIPEDLPVTQPPTAEDQRILREIDPTGMGLEKQPELKD
jgi:glutaconate CoA-transferase subunit B